MEKLDLTKKYKSYYSAKETPAIVQIEKAHCLSICGIGDPNGKEYGERLQALFSVAYTLKFEFKVQQKDFTVAKLEGLWWFDENKYANISGDEAPLKIPRSEWNYRSLIRLPEFVNTKDVLKSIENCKIKKQLPFLDDVSYFEMNEGKCVQILHKGAFENEPATLKTMHEFMDSHDLQKNGHHHEIYLSDFRKTPPEKLKTILRTPVL